MAKKKAKGGKRHPNALPQRFDVWQADIRQINTTVQTDDGIVQPWLVLVVSTTDGAALACEIVGYEPGETEVWGVLIQAMLEPQSEEPHRPTEVQLPAAAAWAAEVRAHLETLDVQATMAERLDEIDEVCAGFFRGIEESLQNQMKPLPGLLDVPDVTPAMGAALFEAAAAFFEQAPWKKIGERPIRVQTNKLDGGPWYAVVLGQGGMAYGLVLYDRLEPILQSAAGGLSPEENAQQTAALALNYGTADELPPADVEAAQEHGWKVAGADAYPCVYRLDPGLEMRPPLAWEVALLEGCLRALPAFAKKKTRRLEPLEITVPTSAGELPLTLSWAESE